MKASKMRRFRGLTWVGWLNFLLLRWFLVRLAYCVDIDDEIVGYKLKWWPSWRF